MSNEPETVSRLLQRWQAGESAAMGKLLPMVYGELRNLAAAELRRHRGHDTFQPTALVNEMVLRLLGANSVQVVDRRHFFNSAARMMRQILVDHARRVQCDKRGGGWVREDFHASLDLPIPDHYELEEVDEALEALEQIDAELAGIVELRFFAGLSVAEVAVLVDKEERTVYRRWSTAKAWLKDRLNA